MFLFLPENWPFGMFRHILGLLGGTQNFRRKRGKAGKTGNISKVWIFNRGQNIWKASHSKFWGGGEMQNMEIQKNCAKKRCGNLDKTSFDKKRP